MSQDLITCVPSIKLKRYFINLFHDLHNSMTSWQCCRMVKAWCWVWAAAGLQELTRRAVAVTSRSPAPPPPPPGGGFVVMCGRYRVITLHWSGYMLYLTPIWLSFYPLLELICIQHFFDIYKHWLMMISTGFSELKRYKHYSLLLI